MRAIWILSFLILCSACKQENSYADYLPYYETIKVRELRDIEEYMQELYTDFNAEPANQKEIDQNLIIEYLTNNKISANRTESGLYYKIYKYGNGVYYRFSSQFSARYTGYKLDGKVFDSNIDHDKPLVSTVGSMIQGWNEGATLVSRRAKVSFFIPSHLAYGPSGVKGVIDPNTVLIFDVEFSAE